MYKLGWPGYYDSSWPDTALGREYSQQYQKQYHKNQMLSRLLYNERVISFHISFKYESFKQCHSREHDTLCDKQSFKENREPYRVGPWDKIIEYKINCAQSFSPPARRTRIVVSPRETEFV